MTIRTTQTTLAVAAACITFAATTASAQVPARLPVHGVLTDEMGSRIDVPANVTFRLYNDMSGGTAFHVETQAVSPENGVFTAFIGANTVLDLTNFRGNEVYLGIEIETDGEMVPRFQLATSAFAAYAEFAQEADDAMSLNGMTASDFASAGHRTDWSEIDNVPADLADGDQVLSQSTVEGFAEAVCYNTPAEIEQAFPDLDTDSTDDLTTATTFGGDVTGVSSNLQLAANSVAAGNIANDAVGRTELANDAVGRAELALNAVGAAELDTNSVGADEIIDLSVGTAELALSSVGTAQIIDRSVGIDDLANDSVGSAQVIDNSLGSRDLAPNSVGASELATNAVGADEIQTGVVGEDELASNSVGSAEVINDSLTAFDLAANSVGSSEILDGAVTSADLANNSVAERQIATAAVTSGKIANGAVTSTKLASNSVTRASLAPDAAGPDEVFLPIGSQFIARTGGFVVGSDNFLFPSTRSYRPTRNGVCLLFARVSIQNVTVSDSGTLRINTGYRIGTTASGIRSGNNSPGSFNVVAGNGRKSGGNHNAVSVNANTDYYFGCAIRPEGTNLGDNAYFCQISWICT